MAVKRVGCYCIITNNVTTIAKVDISCEELMNQAPSARSSLETCEEILNKADSSQQVMFMIGGHNLPRSEPRVELEHNVRCRFMLQERGF